MHQTCYDTIYNEVRTHANTLKIFFENGPLKIITILHFTFSMYFYYNQLRHNFYVFNEL